MQGIAVIIQNRAEIIDAIQQGSDLFPERCPGGLTIPCSRCDHASGAGPMTPRTGKRHYPHQQQKQRAILFATCHWFDRKPVADAVACP